MTEKEAEGLSNVEIAPQLFTSPKMVEHPVSAQLAKVSVPSRGQVAQAASRMGLLPNIGKPNP